jgi:hypothetical protein
MCATLPLQRLLLHVLPLLLQALAAGMCQGTERCEHLQLKALCRHNA